MKLAGDAGVGLTTLKEIELGLSSGQRATIEAISQVLGCSVDDLYGDAPPAKMPNGHLIEALAQAKKAFDDLAEKYNSLKTNPLVRAAEKAGPELSKNLAPLVEAQIEKAAKASAGKSDTPPRRKA